MPQTTCNEIESLLATILLARRLKTPRLSRTRCVSATERSFRENLTTKGWFKILIRSAFDAFLILWWLCAIKQHLSNSDVSVSLERVTLIYFRKVFPSSFHLTSLIRSGTRNLIYFQKVFPSSFHLTNLIWQIWISTYCNVKAGLKRSCSQNRSCKLKLVGWNEGGSTSGSVWWLWISPLHFFVR